MTASDWPAAAARLANADLTRPLAFVVLAAVYFLTRLPFVGYGHGTDPDAWRVALTAHRLLDSGDYFPSRLPGNPLHEFVITLFIPGGWVATNLATAAASLVGVFLFARIVQALRLPGQALLTVGFAFTPLLFINSIATMDYMWTLTALLGAYYAALRGNPLVAGLCLGAAIGFRLQSVILLPAFAYLFWREGNWRDLLPFGLAAGGVAAIVFTPVFVVYGREFTNFYDASVHYQDVLGLLGKEALGVLGGAGVLAGVAISLSRFRSLPADALRDPHVGFWLIVIAVYFASFFRLPHEIAYLIPVFPFGFLLIGRYFTRTAMGIAIAAILVAGIVDITTPGDGIDLQTLRTADIGRGLILSNADTMDSQRRFVRDVMQADVPDHSVVMSGFIFPQLAVRERDNLDLRILERDYGAVSMLSDRGEAVNERRDVRYVWLLTFETFWALRSQGYSFYQVPDAAGGTAALYSYRPALFGTTTLFFDRQSPDAGAGTASTDR